MPASVRAPVGHEIPLPHLQQQVLSMRAVAYLLLALAAAAAALIARSPAAGALSVVAVVAAAPTLLRISATARLEVALAADAGTAVALWWLYGPESGSAFVLFYVVAAAALLLPHSPARWMVAVALAVQVLSVLLHIAAERRPLPLLHVATHDTGAVLYGTGIGSLFIVLTAVLFHMIGARMRRSHRNLEESDQRYRRLIDVSPEPSAIHQDGMLVYVNPAAARLIGAASPDELVGRGALEFLHPDEREVAAERIAAMLRGEPTGAQRQRVVRLDGEVITVEAVAIPITHEQRPALQVVLTDITERLRAEEALRRSEERLRSAFGEAAIGMALVDLNGRYRQVNRAMCELLGYSEEELLSLSWQDITHPDDMERSRQFAEETVATGAEGWHIEKRFLRSDGTSVWVLLNVSLLTDENGRPLRFFSQLQDITERKEAEQALRASEERYKSLFERIPVALYRTTPDGIVRDANPALVELLRYPDRESLLDTEVAGSTYLHPEQRAAWKARIDAEGVVTGFEEQLRRPDGEVIWVQDTARLVRDDDGDVYYEGALVDVTERKQAEASRVRLTQMLEATSDLVVITDPAGHFLYANKAARAFYGAGPDEELPELQFEHVLVDNAEGTALAELAAALVEQGSWEGELSVARPDGSTIPVWAVALAHRDADGTLTHFSAVARDISERRQAQERLENLVRSKDEFVASVSHELRTPLTAVVGLAQELRHHYQAFSEQERTELIDLIAEQSTEVANIVEDLLVAARADTGAVTVEPHIVDVRAAVESIIQVLPEEQAARIRGVEGHAAGWADGIRLRQILRNLITNALRYGGERIEIVLLDEGERLRVEVEDDGPGIPEEARDRIFEPYQRAHEAPSQPASVGLGLTVSRRLARMMGGDLEYRHDGERSVFCLTVPAAPLPAPPDPAATARSR